MKNDANEIMFVMKEKKKGFENISEVYEEDMYMWRCVFNASSPPKAKPGTCIMSKQSEFYRWRPAEATLKENQDNISTEEETKEAKNFDMVFPSKLQLSYANRALLIEL